MFGWVRRLWSGDQGRLLFRYWDGSRWRHADPVRAWAVLEEACGGDVAGLLAKVADASPGLVIPAGPVGDQVKEGREKATAVVLAAVRKALRVAEFADAGGRLSGLTDGETVALLTSFLEYLEGLADAARPKSNSRPAGSTPGR